MATGKCTSGWIDAPFLHPCGPRKRRCRIGSEVNPPPTTITDLEDDVLVEILIRLPNPSHACQSKLVCKRWSSLISDPSFNRRLVSHHQSRNRTPPLFLPLNDPQRAIRSFLPMPPDEVPGVFVVIDSFKDLVLCGFTDPGHANSELGRSYLICNPFTKQWIALPLAPKRLTGYREIGARLACEPRSNINLDLGDGKTFVYSSNFRFRVVSIYLDGASMRLDMFCSESGEWTKRAPIVDGANCLVWPTSLCHGKLFYVSYEFRGGWFKRVLSAPNPFCLDRPPTVYTDASAMLAKAWGFTFSQGGLHVVLLEPPETPTARARSVAIWRLEEDCKSWRKQCEGLVKMSSGMGDYRQLAKFDLVALHPETPEIIFLRYIDPHPMRFVIFSCDLRSGGELEFLDEVREPAPFWNVFQPRVSGWLTPIPRYDEFRGLYDGSYSCWVQSSSSSSEAIRTRSTEECQPVDDVEQSGHGRKGSKRSAAISHPMQMQGRRRVKMQKVVNG